MSIVEKFQLPQWLIQAADEVEEISPSEWTVSVKSPLKAAVFVGGAQVAVSDPESPDHLGFNPFDQDTILLVNGIMLEGFEAPSLLHKGMTVRFRQSTEEGAPPAMNPNVEEAEVFVDEQELVVVRRPDSSRRLLFGHEFDEVFIEKPSTEETEYALDLAGFPKVDPTKDSRSDIARLKLEEEPSS